MTENVYIKEVSKHVEQHGVSGIERICKAKLEAWRDVEINIGVTGDSGVGKSSFINAIRG
jgi:predicted GTPase